MLFEGAAALTMRSLDDVRLWQDWLRMSPVSFGPRLADVDMWSVYPSCVLLFYISIGYTLFLPNHIL